MPPSIPIPRLPLPAQHLLGEFRKESGIDLSGDTLAMQRLREAAEKVSLKDWMAPSCDSIAWLCCPGGVRCLVCLCFFRSWSVGQLEASNLFVEKYGLSLHGGIGRRQVVRVVHVPQLFTL